MIEVEGLSRSYGTTRALREVSFRVGRGEVVGLLGPNGAGKTTTMRILVGSLGATEGTVRVAGHDVAEAPREVARRVGYLPEVPPLYGVFGVAEHVRYAAVLKGVRRTRRVVADALERTGLTEVADRIVDHLSKGYRQRVGLACALVHRPEVLVLDEPTSGLDPAQRVEIRELVRELAAGEGTTVLLSTHVLAEVEAICERVIVLVDGRVVAQDRIDTLGAAEGLVRVRLARPGPRAVADLAAVEGVVEVEPETEPGVLRLRTEGDVRAAIAGAAVPHGLLELTGRPRLEDVYLRLAAGGEA